MPNDPEPTSILPGTGLGEKTDKPPRKVDVERIYELLDELRELFKIKERDYAEQVPLGNIKAARRFGIPAWMGVLVRMGDKWERATNLGRRRFEGRGGPAVKDESVVDTLKDIAVYALICIAMWEQEEGNKKDAVS